MFQAINIARFLVQVGVLVFVNARFFGVAPSEAFVPYLQPSGSPYTIVHGAYESLEIAITHTVFPFIAVAVILGTGMVAGRALCAWACPLGLLQDIMSIIPIKRVRFSGSTTKQLKDIKYAVFGVSMLWSFYIASKRYNAAKLAAEYHFQDEYPRWQTGDSPFSIFSPAATLFAYIPWMVLWNPKVLLTGGIVGWVKIILAVATLVASVFVPRFFCRYVCPLAVCYEPFAKYKVLRIARTKNVSIEGFNRLMNEVCPMGVEQNTRELKGVDAEYITSSSCIHCGRCVSASAAFSQRLVF